MALSAPERKKYIINPARFDQRSNLYDSNKIRQKMKDLKLGKLVTGNNIRNIFNLIIEDY